jgi:hypothetical protein
MLMWMSKKMYGRRFEIVMMNMLYADDPLAGQLKK